MPELPEVETVRRRLAPQLTDKLIANVTIDDPRLLAGLSPNDVDSALVGRRIMTVERRGKYLRLRLDNATSLLSHLRMTGNWLVDADAPRHVRATITLGDNTRVSYTDPRRFGTWDLLDDDAAEAYLAARLGPEPLTDAFDADHLRQACNGRTAAIKAVLLDQRVVAGIGNIYADEALHAADIHPATVAQKLSDARGSRLVDAIKQTLADGIAHQGASIRDFRSPDGAYGSMQEALRVYGRSGLPCPSCATLIVKIRCAGRGTHLCPSCQRP